MDLRFGRFRNLPGTKNAGSKFRKDVEKCQQGNRFRMRVRRE